MEIEERVNERKREGSVIEVKREVKRGKKEEEDDEKHAVPFSRITSEESWKRVKLPEGFSSVTHSVVFQQMTIDYEIEEGQPIIKIYGASQEGHSVSLTVYHFMPYIWIPLPPDQLVDFTLGETALCENFREELNEALKVKFRKNTEQKYSSKKMVFDEDFYDHGDDDEGEGGGGGEWENEWVYVNQVVIAERMDIMYYNESVSKFFRIEFSSPHYVRKARTILEDEGLVVRGMNKGRPLLTKTYESNIAFVLRMMIDCGISGGSWVELPKGKYQLVRERKSNASIEALISYRNLIAHPADDENWSHLAPLRSLSFDIECASKWPSFPDPEKNPVIQIANYVSILGQKEPLLKNIFMLNSSLPLPGVDVRCFSREEDMLMAWSLFIVEVDPDLITGYNIDTFDFPYLVNRAKKLKLTKFANFSRLRALPVSVKETKFSSVQTGCRESKEWNVPGRIIFDMYKAIQKDHKLSSYTLNAVASHFLKDQKEDIHPSMITVLYEGTAKDRALLARYCCKDAFLPQKLIDELMYYINYIEMARVTGVPIIYLLTRGQGIKVVSQILRRSRQMGYLMPTVTMGQVLEFLGAKVLSPIKGFYQKPVATLDFSSLYPSIMIAHNLCYTTLLRKGQEKGLVKDVDYEVTPEGHLFLKKEKKKGILVMILEDILKARGYAKRLMNTATDPFKQKVFNGRQNALKLSANSVYGFTGQANGQLPCLEISSSVTGFGREMILFTKDKVEEHYSIKNGYAYDVKVLYGDTDSVMCLLQVDTVEDAIAWGKEAAPLVSSFFPPPIKLEFEKIYYPWLLMSKKKYAGLFWTKPDKPDKLDAKGIESVRRDNFGLSRFVVDSVLRKILYDRNVQGAVDFAKGVIRDILKNRIDLSLLIITKSYAREADAYKNPQAHIALAKKMKERNPATAPTVGQRIPFVIMKKEKKSSMCDRAEHPLYMMENDIPIDSQYYIDQLIAPLCRLFGSILPNPREVFTTGEHTRELVVPRSITPQTGGGQRGSLANFVIVRESCLGCRAPLMKQEKTLCMKCRENELDIYMKYMGKNQQNEMEFSRLWTQCQRCQGSFHREVICAADDCVIFYKRMKVKKDLEESRKSLAKFDLSW